VDELTCHRCGHTYPQHDPDGGRCGAPVPGLLNPRAIAFCDCPGFRWIDPAGPAVGSYGDPPQRA
jgi:hypothetical protein